MLRHSYMAVICLTVILLSLLLAGCGERSVSIMQSPTATASPPPSPTLELDESASKIDKILNSLTANEEFTGAVLVARNGEVLFYSARDTALRIGTQTF